MTWLERARHEWSEIFRPGSYGCRWRLRQVVNFLDTPWDDLKHKVHGMRVFGWTVRLPKWMMRGSGEDSK